MSRLRCDKLKSNILPEAFRGLPPSFHKQLRYYLKQTMPVSFHFVANLWNVTGSNACTGHYRDCEGLTEDVSMRQQSNDRSVSATDEKCKIVTFAFKRSYLNCVSWKSHKTVMCVLTRRADVTMGT
jgi:hypothetical protein